VAVSSTPPYLFGDLLALARQSWVRQMAAGLAARGYADYRQSDAAVMRILLRRALPVGRLALVLGVTRQAARKVAEGLEQRNLAMTERDPADSRKLNVVLTPAGHAYANAVTEVLHTLNRELAQRVDPGQLAAADAVLRAAVTDPEIRQRAARIPAPSA
jgi:DNA-binding MarR family transcriptional regulator